MSMKNSKDVSNNIYDKSIKFIEKNYFIFAIIILGIITYMCFKNLGTFKVNDWDEARHGVSAYEMFKNKEYVVNTYNYKNDYWNLKPPMSFWAIVAGFKIFGTSVFSMRFYSALSLVTIAVIISIFMYKKYGRLESIIALLSMSACMPLYLSHMGRHGDADALFLLFFTSAMLCMLCIEKNKKYLYFCGLFFALAFLTKSWHAFSIVAVGGLYLLFTGEIKKISLKQWIIFIASFLIPMAIWAGFRVYKDGTTFLTEMVRYDLIERSSTAIEKHKGTVWSYLEFLFAQSRLLMLLMTSSILMGIGYYSSKLKRRKNEVIGYALWIVVPFAIFTKALTKISWYIMPLYIPIILLSSIVIGKFLKEKKSPIILKCLIIIILFSTQVFYCNCIIKYVNNPQTEQIQQFISENIPKLEEAKGKVAYIDLDETDWSQSRVFLCEIKGDLRCNNGGIESFENENSESILITSLDKYNKEKEKFQGQKVLFQNNEYVIILK